MCPPHNVKTWPTPACLSVRATRCPPFSSAMRLLPELANVLPEFLPLDALPVHAFLDECVAHGVDRVPASADVDQEPLHAVDKPVHNGGGLARLAAPARLRFAHGRQGVEARVPPRERAELRVVEEPRGIPRPVDETRGPAKAGLVEIGQNRAHRNNADLLRDEDGAAGIGARERE